MIVPRPAPVRPRGFAPVSGAALPLEDLVAERISSAREGMIEIVGPPGSGKTVALQHLAHVFASHPNVRFLDALEARPCRTPAAHFPDWVVYSLATPQPDTTGTSQLRVAHWGEDEFIEYLLAVHKSACGSVVSRLRAAGDNAFLGGKPALWRLVLDAMAGDAALTSPRHALARFLDSRLTDPKASMAAAACSIAALVYDGCPPQLLKEKLGPFDTSGEIARLLRHRPVQLLIAAQQIVHDVQVRSTCEYFRRLFPRALIDTTAKAAATQPSALAKLQMWFVKPELQANAASILHAAGVGWKPASGSVFNLAGAHLAGAAWRGVVMQEANLGQADFSGADLRDGDLDKARAERINLAGADLRGASLLNFHVVGGDLTGARLDKAAACDAVFRDVNLEHAILDGIVASGASFANANLSGGSFRGVQLCNANLFGATLTGADFTGADLTGARLDALKLSEATFNGATFAEASLAGADLEGMDLPEADFTGAILTSALLTGSSMPRARFDGARLDNAGLADVDWEGVSLRGADLRGASFHLGSSRNGLVGSPIACEGSRTGFYTDDYAEQDFKAPEEIRKANLCFADLRGADITDADFYLVDLRHAKYDPEQETHLRRCGAILHARAEEGIE